MDNLIAQYEHDMKKYDKKIEKMNKLDKEGV